MKKHPTIAVPDIGLMDHAWDLLGEWQAEFELPDADSPVRGKVTFRSWTDAELRGLLGENVLRVLTRAEAVATRLQKSRPASTRTIQQLDRRITP